jgi:iron complex outermembrane receptor protein
MDGDEANSGAMMVPAYTVVDLRLGGEIDKLFWSVSVQNVFNKLYFDYGLDTSFPGNQFFSVYPLQGRTYMVRAGATF